MLAATSSKTTNIAQELDRAAIRLRDVEQAELKASRALKYAKSYLRSELRAADESLGRVRSSDDIEAEVVIACNTGDLKKLEDAHADLKGQRIGLRTELGILDRAHRREVYGTF